MGSKGNFAFIDGANLHNGIRELGWKLDYKRFRIFLSEKFKVTKAYLFLGFLPEQAALYRDLQNWGFITVFKPTHHLGDQSVKGNCDAELVLQAMIDFPDYDGAVIVTGDGDFACLVNYLDKQGKIEQLISPNSKKCSLFLKRAVPQKHYFLDRAEQKLGFRPRK